MELTIPEHIGRQASQSLSIFSRAMEITISDNVSYGLAGSLLIEVKGMQKELEAAEKAMTGPINDGLAKIRNFFRTPKSRLDEAEKSIGDARTNYRAACAARARDATRIAEDAARLERARIAQAAARLEEAARAAADKASAKAAMLNDQGHRERAEAARAASAEAESLAADRIEAMNALASGIPLAPIVRIDPPKSQGVYTVTRWSARVTDKSALIKAVAAGLVPESILTVDMVAINRMAVALHDQLNYPGVVAEKSTTESVRA